MKTLALPARFLAGPFARFLVGSRRSAVVPYPLRPYAFNDDQSRKVLMRSAFAARAVLVASPAIAASGPAAAQP